jgi:hypothetical protein
MDETQLIPVMAGDRTVGVFASGPDGVRFHPVVDMRAVTVAAATAITAIAAAVAISRTRPAIGAVRMGPGGWVSVKGVAPALHPIRHRPWWARLLRARRLVVED